MILLYKFTDGSQVYTYTSHKKDVTFNNEVYKVEKITASEKKLGDNFERIQFTINISISNPLGIKLISTMVEKPVLVEVFRDGILWYLGKITRPSSDGTKILLKCDPDYVNFARSNQVDTVSRRCRYNIYEFRCSVSPTSFEAQYAVINLDDAIIFIPSLAQLGDYYVGGMAKLNGQERTIIYQNAQNLYLDYKFLTPTSGTLFLYPGCDGQRITCTNKFNNDINFGGAEYLPLKNPWDGKGLL
jgi:hypothetical protein